MSSPAHTAADPAAAMDAAAKRAEKMRQHLVRNVRLIAISYLIDGLTLALFALVGTIGWLPVFCYVAAGLSVCIVSGTLYASGWTLRFKDPVLTIPFTILNQSVQVGAMVLIPQVSFMFALILFIIYASLTMQFSVRNSLIAWGLISLCTGAAVFLGQGRMRIPDANLAEQLLAGAFFVLTLWRCVWLGTVNNGMTQLLKNRSKALAELTAKVDHLAHHDELTGLLNRRSLLSALNDELQRVNRHKKSVCVGLIDIDKFKLINDTLGHLAGDKTLKIFSSTLQRHTRKTDRFGRYGGEEFLIVMIGADLSTAQVPIDRMRYALTFADWSDVGPNVSVTFSCGLACYEPGETSEAFIQRADNALYRAKAEGRNCTRLA